MERQQLPATNRSVVRIDGDLTAVNVHDLRANLRNMIEDGVTELVIDLENTTMLDSAGVGLIVAAHNSLSRVGGTLQVIQVSPEILELLQSMRLHQHFTVVGK
jgi:anti-anti-sigma factor